MFKVCDWLYRICEQWKYTAVFYSQSCFQDMPFIKHRTTSGTTQASRLFNTIKCLYWDHGQRCHCAGCCPILRYHQAHLSQPPHSTYRHGYQVFITTTTAGGTRSRGWLRHCATSRKVAGSIPNVVIGIFYWYNSSDRTMALRLTQCLTEICTRNTY